jgi:predicted PurR-regulated permease PerM
MVDAVDRSDLQRLFSLAVILIIAWVVWRLTAILTPFVLAALFAYLGRPLTLMLQRIGLGGVTAAAVTLLIEALTLFAMLGLLIPLLVAQGAAIAAAMPEAMQSLGELSDGLGLTLPEGAALVDLMREQSGNLGTLVEQGLIGLMASTAGIVAVLGNLILIPVLTFYALRDYDMISAWVTACVPADDRPRFTHLASASDDALSGFLRGQLAVMASLAAIYSVGLGLIGVQYGIALGVFAGLVSFVPYLGTIIGIALASSMALVQGGDIGLYIGILLTFGVGQLMEGMVLTPRLVGDRIGLHPALVIFAVLAGGALFGFLGVLIALPASAVLVAVIRATNAKQTDLGPDPTEHGQSDDD